VVSSIVVPCVLTTFREGVTKNDGIFHRGRGSTPFRQNNEFFNQKIITLLTVPNAMTPIGANRI
jgi:hypothetical protein